MSIKSQDLTLPFPVARILLAEDLMINQELTRRSLEAIGHQVDVVADGAAALAAVQGGSYDLILMDVQMPVMDGIAATAAIRALSGPAQTVPIIALTSHTHPFDVAKFGPAGMDSYLAKPYADHDLYALVELWQSEGAVRQEAAPKAASRPALDPAVYQGVEQIIGAERIQVLFKMLRQAFDEPIEVEPAGGPDRDKARFALHALVSQAGQIGFVELSEAARSLENAIAEDHPCEADLEHFRRARKAALAEVDRRLAA